jgi:hypothetical protein
MKKILTLCILNLIMLSASRSESIAKPFNDLGYGTLSGRVQSLSMYRDFETGGKGNGANSTLGVVLGYTSPEIAGFDAGLAYNYSFQLANHNNWWILANDDVNLLNEGWVRYNFGALGFTNTTVLAGRKIVNGEVFRKDDFRQKSRSIETVQLDSKDIEDTQFTIGHAIRLSNWIQAGDRQNFNDFGDVFGAGEDTDGVTWGEVVNKSVQGLEVALFDAYAYDVANLIGTRIKFDITESTALLGYYRHENDVGDAVTRNSDAYGLSLVQKIGNYLTVEPGVFSVHGNNLRFQETTTGINHALGASMEICSCQFDGGADTAYLKATAKIDKTTLYLLYNYTSQSQNAFDGQELNLVAKQAISDSLSVAFKYGIGYRDWDNGQSNTTDTDTRLFVTYTF